METSSIGKVTRLLERLNAGEEGAMERLIDVVYEDLRAMAHRQMNRVFGPGHPGVTLQPTALAHETYLKLIKQRRKYDNRGHFFALATKIMIRVLIDYQRNRKAGKRGGDWVRKSLDVDVDAVRPDAAGDPRGRGTDDLPALLQALDRLETLDARKADVVKYRVFWGLSKDEIVKNLDISRATVNRDWKFAKAWLKKEIEEREP